MPLSRFGLGLFLSFVLIFAVASSGHAGVVINEFSATGGLTDLDGEEQDWIEFFNTGPGTVDLAGTFLTDDAGNPTKWQFPDLQTVVLEAGDYLVVFASGKNIRTGAELHTNFGLSASGEYLGHYESDGTTVIHEFAPSFPRQVDDISYGLAAVSDTLVPLGAEADWLVPTSSALEGVWNDTGFTPGGSWSAGATALGFDAGGDGGAFPPPVSVWNFDGDLEDSAGTNHGTARGGAINFEEGHEGDPDQAATFSGANYIEVDRDDVLPVFNRPAYTISMWVKGAPQDDNRVYSEGSSTNNTPLFTMGTHFNGSSGAVDIFIRYSGGGSPNHMVGTLTAFDGTWHHIVWTDNDGDAALYVDGVRDPADFSYGKQAMSLNRVSFGAVLRASPCCQFQGSIDQVAMWDEILPPAEIAELAAGAPPSGGSILGRAIETDVGASMQGENASIWTRIPFEVDDSSLFDSLSLDIRYNDGFVAFLNGTEVAFANAPNTLRWNSSATAERDAAASLVSETVNLTPYVDLLVDGTNVLAIQGLNVNAGDGNFLLEPKLTAAGSVAQAPRYLGTPTPGAANEDDFIDFVADTVFSIDRGVYEVPFDVEITTETPGAQIRYTTNGSAPTSTSGTVYTGPVRIDETTILRAAAFRSGWEPTNVDTQTYLFLDDVIRQPTRPAGYPSSWAGYAADYAMDPQICTNTNAPTYVASIKEDLMAVPTVSVAMSIADFMGSSGIYQNPLSRGVAWERPCSIEFISHDGREPDFQIDAGVRMQGGSSARPVEGKHSFRFLFKSIYGASKLRYRLFPDSKVEQFDTITFRCCSTDSWHFKDGGGRYRRWDSQYIRDMFMRDTQLAMGQPSSHGRYVHLYVNGLYWGLYNPTERPDDSFNRDHNGGEEEDWDVVKDFNELFRGTRTAWNDLMAQCRAGLTTQAAYQRIQGNNPDGSRNPAYPIQLDVDNLIDYMILHLYGCAEDWPHHNWYAARNRTGEFGGWRWFSWDQEITMDFVYRDRLGVSNSNSPAYVYNAARRNAEFRVRFGDRVHKHLFNDGVLTNDSAIDRWMLRATEIDRAIVGESARWGDFRVDRPDPGNTAAVLYTRDNHWMTEQEKVLGDYIPGSHTRAISRFRRENLYPDVDAPVFPRHGGYVDDGFELRMTATEGTVLYTLDGEDPRLTGGATSGSAQEFGVAGVIALLPSGAPAKALVPTDDSLGLDWIERTFNDATWKSGTTGVGYERTSGYQDLIGLDMRTELDGENASVYIRIPFDLDEAPDFDSLVLRMKYDDGFICYLNGQEVARRNAAADTPWDGRATAPHSDSQAIVFEDIDITDRAGLLRQGDNVLAIHGLNSSPTSSDCLLLPELAVSSTTGDGVMLRQTTQVRARAKSGADWSALNEAFFIVDEGLRISEVMYHPMSPDAAENSPWEQDEFEFVEIVNKGDTAIDLTGVRFVEGIEFDFTDSGVTLLPPGEAVVVVENIHAFASRYDLNLIFVAGEYSGKLANDGERLRLVGALGETLHDFEFSDLWYPDTDGGGPSLVVADPSQKPTDGLWSEKDTWRESEFESGSPGVDETEDPPVGGLQRIGDINQDQNTDVSDGITLLRHLFIGDPATLPCGDGSAAHSANRMLIDVNGDAGINLSDAVYMLTYLFQGGPAPVGGTGCKRIEGCENVCGG